MARAASPVSTLRSGTRWGAARAWRAAAPSSPTAATSTPRPLKAAPAPALTEVQEHDDGVLLILGIVVWTDAHGAKGEPAVKAQRDGIRSTDLEGHISADLAAGEVDHVGEHARGVARAARLGVRRDVEDVNLVGDEPIVAEGHEL